MGFLLFVLCCELLPRLHGAPYGEGRHRVAHVVHAHDGRAAVHGQHRRRTLGTMRSPAASMPVTAPIDDLRDQPSSSG
jgi:hypothetical protein